MLAEGEWMVVVLTTLALMILVAVGAVAAGQV
jgi:hypothetical protein